MSTDTYLIPVRQADIEIGKPLSFAVFDGDHHLLLNQGEVVDSEEQLQALLAKRLFRERKRPDYSSLRKSIKGHESSPKKEEADKPPEELLTLDALNLMPGDNLQLQPLLDGVDERWPVRVIGHMKHKSLIVTAPVMDGKLIYIKEGQVFLVRVFSGLNVCAFKSRVLKVQLQPFPYLHLSWSDNVQAMRIRKALRCPTSIIVAVLDKEEGRQTGAGRIVDISVAGAKLHSPTRLGKMDEALWLTFKVTLGDMEEYVKTTATIRSISEDTDEEGTVMKAYGIEFGALSQPQRLIIMNVVYQYLLKESV